MLCNASKIQRDLFHWHCEGTKKTNNILKTNVFIATKWWQSRTDLHVLFFSTTAVKVTLKTICHIRNHCSYFVQPTWRKSRHWCNEAHKRHTHCVVYFFIGKNRPAGRAMLSVHITHTHTHTAHAGFVASPTCSNGGLNCRSSAITINHINRVGVLSSSGPSR